MSIYIFENPRTGEIKELSQKMSDEHVYIDEEGLEWKRLWTPINFSIDGKINPWSKNSFETSTQDKNYTLGEMWDRSAEMSAARADKEGGVDPVAEQWKKDYSKKRKGTKYTKDGNLMGKIDAVNVELD